jgi:streptogramin lyase
MMAHRMRHGLTALAGALTLVGSLLCAAPSGALAPPGGVEEFPFSIMEDTPTSGFVAGPDGNIWFTDNAFTGGTNVGKVGLINQDGQIHEYVVPTAPGSTEHPEHSDPYQIAQGPNDTLWFTDLGENSNGEQLIGQVALGKGEPQIKEFPGAAKENELGPIAAGPEGNMWFSTSMFASEDKIWRITPKGELHLVAGLGAHGFYPNIGGLAQGPGGYMWFTERDENEAFIGRINASTDKYEHFPIPTKNSYPGGIAPGPNGNMWFVESGTSQIGEINSKGEIKEFPATSTNYSTDGIVEGPDGNMWFTQATINSIGRIGPSGEVKSFPIPTPQSEPAAIARGADSNIWFMDARATEVSPTPGTFYHIGRLTTPYLPTVLAPPTITGTPTAGQVLTATPGSWTNSPGSFAYQWQECEASGAACSNLPGETGVAHPLGAGEVGHTLRVIVTATNVAGAAAKESAPSAVVASPPPPPPPPKVTPSVEASMTWTFGWTRKFTLVESLVAHGVPRGGKVEVVCHGHGCPFSHHTSATVASHHSSHHTCQGRKCKKPKPRPQGPEVSLTSLFKGRHLGVGATISMRIVKSGWIGKSFVFTMRSGQTPHVQVSCLAPGSTTPGKGC